MSCASWQNDCRMNLDMNLEYQPCKRSLTRWGNQTMPLQQANAILCAHVDDPLGAPSAQAMDPNCRSDEPPPPGISSSCLSALLKLRDGVAAFHAPGQALRRASQGIRGGARGGMSAEQEAVMVDWWWTHRRGREGGVAAEFTWNGMVPMASQRRLGVFNLRKVARGIGRWGCRRWAGGSATSAAAAGQEI